MKEAFRAAVRAAVDPELIYGLLWPARVVDQHPITLELDLLVDHETFRGDGWSGIPLKTGVAGFKSKVKRGDRVLVGFEEADPSKPYAMMLEPSMASVSFNDGTRPVARKDDTVHCGYLLVQTAPSPGAQHFTHTQEQLALAAQSAITGSGGLAVLLPLAGVVTSGNDNLTA